MNLIERIEALALVGATDKGICRAAGSPEDEAGKALCIKWMLEAGMSVRRDEWGNIIGRLDGIGDPIVTGSHTDTVPTAGKYDGALGVLAGIHAAETLKGCLRSPLEVVIFYDEETTMCGSIGYCADMPDLSAFVELHVEQGPVLDVERKDIGIVTGIVGQRRTHFTVMGQENHAGTTPMNMRDDALVKASSLITYVDQLANEDYDGLVATVGELTVSPNSFSVIPGQVDLTLQVRDLDADNMDKFVETVSKSFDLRYDIVHQSEPALCDPVLRHVIDEVADELGLSAIEMPSRASHDAQNFVWCPMAMIFVPSVNGISHSPDEETTEEMCINGANVLTEVIRRLDGSAMEL